MTEDVALDTLQKDGRPDRVPEHLLDYWQRVQAGLQQAQAELAQANQLQTLANARIGAYESFVEYLGEICGFDPGRERPGPDGRIVRETPAVNGAS